MITPLRITLFGYPAVALADRALLIDERKALAALAYLAVSGVPPDRQALCVLLWPDYDPPRALANLRHALWSLKKANLGDWLVSSRESVALRAGAWIDVVAFHQALRAGALEAAEALYQDDFLAGFTLRDAPEFDAWQQLQAQQRRDDLADALRRLADAHTAAGSYDRALVAARRWLALDPLHEAVHRRIMRLYALAGQPAAALHQYELCVQLYDYNASCGSRP